MRDSTGALIEAYRAASEADATCRRRMLELLKQGDAAFASTYYTPGHFTASAIVVAPAGDAVLLIKHAALGRWLQPGGHIETTDTDPLAAARREAEEETGVTLYAGGRLIDLDIHGIPARDERPEHLHFDLRFVVNAQSMKLTATREVDGAQWCDMRTLEEIAGDASVLRAVANALHSD